MNAVSPTETVWDVIVIGGGPSGMMAAGRAAERGKRVLLVEKNKTLGKKLLITGGGRCNVTNAEFDDRAFLEKFKDTGKFLFSAFSQWSVEDTLAFFNSRGMETKVENEKRVFPASNSAQSVWNVLVQYIQENNVEILSDSPVSKLLHENNHITGVLLKNSKTLLAKNVVVAAGGTSRPETGSTGDAYQWLEQLGHTVTIPEPSLVPIKTSDAWAKLLAGKSLSDVKITVLQNDVKQFSKVGKLLFTHVGLSGPAILNMSKDIGELLKYGEVVISLDLFPSAGYDVLNTRLQALFKQHDKKKFKNALADLAPPGFVEPILELSSIDPEKASNSVTREERLLLIKLLKDIPLHVESLLGTDKAIITSGGVSLEDVDLKTCRSRLFSNLYLIGDVLDNNRPTGGYSLQLAWTTGFVAGNSIQ